MTGAALARQLQRRLARAMLLSNSAGALVVFVFLYYLLPLKASGPHQRSANTVAFGFVMVAGIVLGTIAGTRVARPIRTWLRSEAPADDAARRAALRQPLRQTVVNASLWATATAGFALLNAYWDLGTAFDVALTIALGGFATCGIAYLLCERCTRPAVTRAMASSSEPPPLLLGVRARLVLAWGLGSGIPLVAIVLATTSPGHDRPPLPEEGVVFLAAVGLVAGLVAMLAAAGGVSDPVRSVAAALRAVGAGRLDVTVPVYDASEVGRLQSGFNTMVRGLQERDRLRDLFGRQVGDDVAALAVERGVELGGETRDVAVLFVDVVGSTALAESLDPQEVVRRLNAFFGVVIDVVQEHDGWVNKFEGDAALCVFGAPVAVDDPATCALSAARELAQRLRPLEVDAAIGVAAGAVVAGHVGAESRFEYTVIGDPVNAAARLTDLAKTSSGCVLADAVLLEQASADEAACWQPGDEVVLRGRRTPTRLACPR